MLVVAFMGVFTIIFGTVASYALTQSRYGRALYAREQALHIAEAGLEYYKWFLAHNPSIMQTGNGLVSPYTYAVLDPEGGELGEAEITATANTQCDAVQWVDLSSRATSNADQAFPRTISSRYMLPSVAEYSYLLNSNVWAGSDRNIRGPYHSNGGVRMDATHNSDVTSAVATWNCTSSYNCSPAQPTAPGVVGTGSNPALWTYPVPSINFAGIGVDLADLKTRAQNNGGVYYGPANGNVNHRGYRVTFNSDGTANIRRITSTLGHSSYSSQYGWGTDYSSINNSSAIGTYTIPSDCALLFFEDRVWVEGVVKGKVTIVASTPDDSSTSPDAYLNDNITYASSDGSDGLTVIAERNVLIPLVVPDVLEIHGIFVAVNGHYGRDYYNANGQWAQYEERDQLTTIGTVVSNGRTGTAWSDGQGFAQRYDYYDQLLAFSPPPFTPIASTDYQFALWREE